ncbi:MAG: ribosome recycling factor [Bradymonadia bacterium]|jgi:ribosome recycling factor
MFDAIESDLMENFDAAETRLRKEFARIRTGRANASILDGVMVPYYGSPTPLAQLATVKVPEPRMLTIAPWERNILSDIERALLKADLGLTPNNDGSIIRLSIPPLSGERRQDLAKQARKLTEDARISVRNARRDANELLKVLEKDSEITEDDMHRDLAKVQTLTDAAIAKVDGILTDKEQEILEV